MKPLSILIYGLTATRGGLETYIRDFMDYCIDRNIRLGFIVKYDDVCFRDFIYEHGWKIYKMPPRISNPIVFFKRFFDINKQDHYDILYINMLTAEEIYSALPAKLCGMKIITHSHNNLSNTIRMHKLFKPIVNMIANKRLACSKGAAEFMYGNKKAEIIKNAIDVKKFSFNKKTRKEYREEFKIKDDEFVLCHVGRMSRQKNPYAVVDIFENVYKNNKHTFLIYVGDGEDRQKTEAYIAEKNLDQNTFLLGSRSDISEILSMSDVFILPSLYEGFGYVAIESQASGLPTIISKEVPDDVMVTALCKKLPTPLRESKDYKNIVEVWRKEIEAYRSCAGSRHIDDNIFAEAGLDVNQKKTRYVQYDNIFYEGYVRHE